MDLSNIPCYFTIVHPESALTRHTGSSLGVTDAASSSPEVHNFPPIFSHSIVPHAILTYATKRYQLQLIVTTSLRTVSIKLYDLSLDNQVQCTTSSNPQATGAFWVFI